MQPMISLLTCFGLSLLQSKNSMRVLSRVCGFVKSLGSCLASWAFRIVASERSCDVQASLFPWRKLCSTCWSVCRPCKRTGNLDHRCLLEKRTSHVDGGGDAYSWKILHQQRFSDYLRKQAMSVSRSAPVNLRDVQMNKSKCTSVPPPTVTTFSLLFCAPSLGEADDTKTQQALKEWSAATVKRELKKIMKVCPLCHCHRCVTASHTRFAFCTAG